MFVFTGIVEEQRARQAGWKEFILTSFSYCEDEIGNKRSKFLFHPGVDLSRWLNVEFSHGKRTQSASNDEFDAWLEKLTNDSYILIEDVTETIPDFPELEEGD